MKHITIQYCETNEKYDVFGDGDYLGKFYNLEGALMSLLRDQLGEMRRVLDKK